MKLIFCMGRKLKLKIIAKKQKTIYSHQIYYKKSVESMVIHSAMYKKAGLPLY